MGTMDRSLSSGTQPFADDTGPGGAGVRLAPVIGGDELTTLFPLLDRLAPREREIAVEPQLAMLGRVLDRRLGELLGLAPGFRHRSPTEMSRRLTDAMLGGRPAEDDICVLVARIE